MERHFLIDSAIEAALGQRRRGFARNYCLCLNRMRRAESVIVHNKNPDAVWGTERYLKMLCEQVNSDDRFDLVHADSMSKALAWLRCGNIPLP